MNWIFAIGLIFGAPVACMADGGVPSWTKSATKLDGKTYTTVCSGQGPSVDLARAASLNSCKSSAATALSSTFSVSTTTIQTEQSSGLHEVVESSEKYENLSCDPQKEEIIESSGSYKVWTLCRFSLDKVQAKAEPAKPEVRDKAPLSVIDDKLPTNYTHGTRRKISLAVVPQCESVIVLGSQPRIVDCTSSPVLVIISPNDSQLIIRGDVSEYQPKKINLNQTENRDETLQVFLERN